MHSVQAAPRIFDGSSLSSPVAVTKVARNLSKYDDGSDLDLLREMLDRTEEQEAFLEAAQDDDWRRPLLQTEEATNPARNIFTQPINALPVAQTPAYRLRSVLVEGASPEADARAWQKAFAEVGRHRTSTECVLLLVWFEFFNTNGTFCKGMLYTVSGMSDFMHIVRTMSLTCFANWRREAQGFTS